MEKKNLRITLFNLDAGQTEIFNYTTSETVAQNGIELILFFQVT